jgi:hypothetical protein
MILAQASARSAIDDLGAGEIIKQLYKLDLFSKSALRMLISKPGPAYT